MRDRLTEGDISSYRENGFLVIPDFLAAAEVEGLVDAIDSGVTDRGGNVLPEDPDAYPIGKQIVSAEQARMLTQCFNLWQTSPRVRQFTLDERLGRLACDLEGIDGVRIWHDQWFAKPPWGVPTVWHVDTPLLGFESDHTVSFWFALADATLLNGCLYYIPGSHRGRWTASGAPNRPPQELEDREAVACPVSKGAMIAHNGYTAHAANGNMTPHHRHAFAITYMPDGAAFDGTHNILTHEQLSRLKVGDPFQDAETHPLVFSREPAHAAR